jgi:hypothetical protein
MQRYKKFPRHKPQTPPKKFKPLYATPNVSSYPQSNESPVSDEGAQVTKQHM